MLYSVGEALLLWRYSVHVYYSKAASTVTCFEHDHDVIITMIMMVYHTT